MEFEHNRMLGVIGNSVWSLSIQILDKEPTLDTNRALLVSIQIITSPDNALTATPHTNLSSLTTAIQQALRKWWVKQSYPLTVPISCDLKIMELFC